MNKKVVVSVVFLTIALIFLFVARSANIVSDVDSKRTNLMVRIPNFSSLYIDSTIFNSEEIIRKKNPVIFHFWATWCGPCESEFPQIIEFAKKFEGRKLDFYFVAVSDTKENVVKFLKKFSTIPSNVHIVIETTDAVLEKFGTFKVPETFVFDNNGTGVRKYVGPQNWLNPSYLDQINEVVH